MSQVTVADAEKTVECIIPILNVADLAASVAFYARVLGFKTDWNAGTTASVSRDGRAIMLCQQDQGPRGTWVWIGVDDIEPVYADFVAKGASIRLKPTNFSLSSTDSSRKSRMFAVSLPSAFALPITKPTS